jgi:DNA-binding PadR family transcriptional regulator
MSIRQSLLALLDTEPRYGYQLRLEFERRTGGTWPLNVGQVYSTLARLERDGLVSPVESADDASDQQVFYAITEAGRAAVREWFASPVERTAPARDELAIKLALAVTVPGVDVQEVVQRQRTATLRALQAYTKLKAKPPADEPAREDLAWSLVLESLIFAAEAEVRWLDHCEARLARVRHAGEGPAAHDHEGVGRVRGEARPAEGPSAHDHEGVAR